jgi:hypothetical protein
MNKTKYRIEYEHTVLDAIEVLADNESQAEDMAFETFEKDELVAPMITRVVELD